MGRRIVVELLVVAAVGLALAALGPFGSYAIPFGSRAVYWMGSMLAGYAIVRPMVHASRWLSEQTAIGFLPAQVLALTVAAVPLSLLIGLSWGRLGASGRVSFGELYLQVWGIGFAMSLLMNNLFPDDKAPGPPAVEPSGPIAPDAIRPRFLDRLPATVGSPLLCLSMEDHYVRAHGPAGSALVLMRMRDAVAELDGLPGLQVHRSWWVASAAVERVEKENGRLQLRLVNGVAVPVARSQLGAVRAQRWPGG